LISFGFLNPLLLWALPLAAVPIVIHLLNRRRYERRPWAAMTFLLAALARNRRRIFMEQWLLLLLRVLAVVLLVMAVSRPQWAGTLLGEQRTHHVVCVDDSTSMAQRSGAGNAFQRAVAAVEALADAHAGSRAGDLWTLVRASRPDRPDLAAIGVEAGLGARVRQATATFALADGTLELGALLRSVLAQAELVVDARRTVVHLITDFRAVDWLDPDGKPRADVVAALAGLDPQQQRIEVVVVGERSADNVGVADLRPLDRTLVAGVPLEFAIELRNFGAETSAAGELVVEVDGRSRTVLPLAPLAADETRTLTVRQTFPAAGFHGIEARLSADRYPVDDARALALEALEHSRVLLVDGAPGDAAEDSETYYLAAALAPGGDARSGIAPTVLREHQLGDEDLQPYDLIVLCNVAAPAEPVVTKLEQFVLGGGGLVVFAGDQVEPGLYNARLWRGGAGLLPAPLGEVAGDMDAPPTVFVADREHRIFGGVQDALEQWFARHVLVGRWVGLAAAPGPDVRTLLRVRNATGPELMLVRAFRPDGQSEGGGEVALITTTADIAWTNWPASVALLVVMHETHHALGRRHDPSPHNHGPLDTHEVPLDLSRLRPDVVVRAPADGETRTFTAEVGADAARSRATIPLRELAGFGLFRVELTPFVGAAEQRLLAKRPPLAESRLQPMTRPLLQRSYPEPALAALSVREGADAADPQQAGAQSDLWRLFGLAMVFALLVESLFAAFVITRHQRDPRRGGRRAAAVEN
jgi:hypothetical protein